jgi:hypothetical protein
MILFPSKPAATDDADEAKTANGDDLPTPGGVPGLQMPRALSKQRLDQLKALWEPGLLQLEMQERRSEEAQQRADRRQQACEREAAQCFQTYQARKRNERLEMEPASEVVRTVLHQMQGAKQEKKTFTHISKGFSVPAFLLFRVIILTVLTAVK